MKNSRRIAAFVVARWLISHDFPSNLLPDGPDHGFVQDIVYTVIRRLRALRKTLGALVQKWPKGELEALLYVGAAQILYMDDVPDFAAVNETVEAAKVCDNPAIAKVVNGVLRNLIRRKAELLGQIEKAPLEERESFPTEIVRRWKRRFGDENAARLCHWHNMPAETFLARKDGTFVSLERGKKVSEVEGYDAGEFIVQDPGTAIAVGMLNAKLGDCLFDACAAPGGKTIQLAWRGASVVACEINPRRRNRLIENVSRMGLDGLIKVIADFPDPSSAGGRFSKILVDAPCSNTGVFRRRPDARWNWSIEKLNQLTRLQSEILDQAAKLLSKEGMIVYSTCSNEPEENQDQVNAFLARHPDFSLEEIREALPFESGTDGAFAARLVKI